MCKIVVTGLGIISSIGISVEETLDALKRRHSGAAAVRQFDTVHRNIPVCEVKYNIQDLRELLHLPSGKPYSRTSLLGLIAARQAMQSSHSDVPTDRMGLVSATTVGGMDYNEAHYKALSEHCTSEEVELLDCADATQKIAELTGISTHVTTVSTACSSSANAIITGVRMIRNGLVDKVLTGGADALTRFTLNGFNALEILSPDGCKPFDAERNGITLGEGAAYLVLEAEATAIPGDILCTLSGHANISEAYHQTASSPEGEGAMMAIRKALSTAGLTPGDIDYINAHGTGTVVNDLSEGRAIDTVFRDKLPAMSSTKGYTGHTLAAAGAIEAVISALSIRHQIVFPNIGFTTRMPELSFSPNMAYRSADVRHVLSNSFGFGGSNSSLIFSQY